MRIGNTVRINNGTGVTGKIIDVTQRENGFLIKHPSGAILPYDAEELTIIPNDTEVYKVFRKESKEYLGELDLTKEEAGKVGEIFNLTHN